MIRDAQFCKDCNNLLCPHEDKEHRQLIFMCRSCTYLHYADPQNPTENCVDRINYNFRSKEDVNSYIAAGLGHDPTLPRVPGWRCPECAHVGAVYFQLPERVADDAMTLVFVCTDCTYYEVRGKQQNDETTDPTPLTQQPVLPEDEEDESLSSDDDGFGDVLPDDDDDNEDEDEDEEHQQQPGTSMIDDDMADDDMADEDMVDEDPGDDDDDQDPEQNDPNQQSPGF